jgi:hypothetical protein
MWQTGMVICTSAEVVPSTSVAKPVESCPVCTQGASCSQFHVLVILLIGQLRKLSVNCLDAEITTEIVIQLKFAN